MKNKILMALTTMIFLLILLTLPSYAAEANVILEKDSNVPNKVKVFLEVSNEQSLTATNVVLNVNSSNKVNLATPEFNWSNEIAGNNEIAKWTYNNDKVNLYVISKNELGAEASNGRKLLEVGTLTVNTKNQEETTIDISVPQDGLKIASLDHKIAMLTNTDIATSTQLVVNKKEENTNNPSGDNNNQGSSNQGSNNQGNNQGNNNQSVGTENNNPPAGGDNNSSAGVNTNNPSIGSNNNNQGTGTNNQGNGNNNQSGGTTNIRPITGINNNSSDQSDNDIENNVTNEIENETVENNISNNENKITNKVQNNIQVSNDLQDKGEEENKSKLPYVIGCIVLALVAIFVIYIINKPKRKKKGNYYK